MGNRDEIVLQILNGGNPAAALAFLCGQAEERGDSYLRRDRHIAPLSKSRRRLIRALDAAITELKLARDALKVKP